MNFEGFLHETHKERTHGRWSLVVDSVTISRDQRRGVAVNSSSSQQQLHPAGSDRRCQKIIIMDHSRSVTISSMQTLNRTPPLSLSPSVSL